jgi:DNA-directed RNA polymerase specialized sigma subunit
MAKTVTPEQVVEAAKELGQNEFTREDLAQKLGVEKPELKQGFRQARQAGNLDKVGEDEKGTGRFRLTGK